MIATWTFDGLTAGVHLVSPPPANRLYRLAGTAPPASLNPASSLVLNLVRLLTRLRSFSGGRRQFENS
jgi:hypothetical protein